MWALCLTGRLYLMFVVYGEVANVKIGVVSRSRWSPADAAMIQDASRSNVQDYTLRLQNAE